MNSAPTQALGAKPIDQDIAEQARPGHGIPSQDPDLSAQTPLKPKEADREANSVLVGGGLVAGAAAGAAIGVMVAGPMGVVVGAAVGAAAGALGGEAAGTLENPSLSGDADKAGADTARPHIDHPDGGQDPAPSLQDPGR